MPALHSHHAPQHHLYLCSAFVARYAMSFPLQLLRRPIEERGWPKIFAVSPSIPREHLITTRVPAPNPGLNWLHFFPPPTVQPGAKLSAKRHAWQQRYNVLGANNGGANNVRYRHSNAENHGVKYREESNSRGGAQYYRGTLNTVQNVSAIVSSNVPSSRYGNPGNRYGNTGNRNGARSAQRG